LGKCIK